MDSANRVIRAIVDLPVPVLAQVRGAAVGVGASIALAADLTYAAEDAYLLFAFVNVGLMPDGGSSALIAASIGRARARAIALTKQALTATTLTELDPALGREKAGQTELLQSPDFAEGSPPCSRNVLRTSAADANCG